MPTVDLKFGSRELGKIGDKLHKVAGRALYSAAIRGVSVIQTELIPKRVPSPVDRSTYKAGWRAEPALSGDGIIGGDIFNIELHALFIERGVRASSVKIGGLMLRALAEWARRKGLVDGNEDPKKVAWAIARGMQKRGIFKGGEGLRILEELMTKRMPKIVREELKREMASGAP